MTERKKAAPLRVENGVLVERQRDGLLLKVPVFVVDDAPRPDLAGFLRGRGSAGFAEVPWSVDERDGQRGAVLHVSPGGDQTRPFDVVFRLDLWAGLLEAAANAGELGLVLSTVTLLPPPHNGLTLWIRGQNEMLHAILEAEN